MKIVKASISQREIFAVIRLQHSILSIILHSRAHIPLLLHRARYNFAIYVIYLA